MVDLRRFVAALALIAGSFTLARVARATPETWARSATLESQGNSRGALETLEALPDAERQGYLYALRRGWLLYLQGRHDESVAAYRLAAGAARDAIEPQLGELLPLMALRRWQETESRAREILRRDPQNYLARRRLALALYNLGRFDAARTVYQGVLAHYPGDLEMLSGVGWCDLRRGHRDEAAASFRAVLAVSPDDATAAAGLAACAGR